MGDLRNEEKGENLMSNILIASIAMIFITYQAAFAGLINDEADKQQAISAASLKEFSGEKQFNLRTRNGIVRSLNLDVSAKKLNLGQNPEEISMNLLEKNSALFRIQSPRQNLRIVKKQMDSLKVLIYRQSYKDIPVYGAWLRIMMAEEENGLYIRSILGNYIPDFTPKSTSSVITSSEALSKVAQKQNLDRASIEEVVPAKLWFYDHSLLEPECQECLAYQSNPRLAWRIIFASSRNGGAITDAFVDAVDGEVLSLHPRIYQGKEMSIETANNTSSLTCWYMSTDDDAWFDEDGVCQFDGWNCTSNICDDSIGCSRPDNEGWTAYNATSSIYDYYRDVFGMDSYDNDGAEIKVYVHVNPAAFDNGLPNAHSKDCGIVTIHEFANGTITQDILGHEIGHSFHRSQVDYVYENESGAIAEHIADAMGTFVGKWNGRDTNWLQGEGSSLAGNCGAVRNLQNPPSCGQPDHYSNYRATSGDHGGVHINSGILNKALYLMTDGDTHRNIIVRGLGRSKIEHLYYFTIRSLPDNPKFIDFRDFMVGSCISPFGTKYSYSDCCQVMNAFAAVGIGIGDIDCDGTLDNQDKDDDHDGIPDAVDNCQSMPNTSQYDTDKDGIGDRCDSDIDGDGIPNGRDNCPYVSNSNQRDSDGNGVGDACQDSDGDGIFDLSDNCPKVPNALQEDIDRDRIGDACDSDIDNDGIPNKSDNCPYFVNLDQRDSDGDNVGDICDNCRSLDNPSQQDMDRDGKGDLCDEDKDGDGILNEEDACPDKKGPIQLSGCPPPDTRHFKFKRKWIPIWDPITIGINTIASYPDLKTMETVKFRTSFTPRIPSNVMLKKPVSLDVLVMDENGNIRARNRELMYKMKMKRNLMSKVKVPFGKKGTTEAFLDRKHSLFRNTNMTSDNTMHFKLHPSCIPNAATSTQDASVPAYYLILRPSVNDANDIAAVKDAEFDFEVDFDFGN
jgi:Zn-dependent metalloprotease